MSPGRVCPLPFHKMILLSMILSFSFSSAERRRGSRRGRGGRAGLRGRERGCYVAIAFRKASSAAIIKTRSRARVNAV